MELDTGTSDLHPPTRKVKSAVWKFFGYPRDTAGLVLSDGFPICKLCQKKVSAKGGNTTNMFTHLRDYHRTTYNEIKVQNLVFVSLLLPKLHLYLVVCFSEMFITSLFTWIRDNNYYKTWSIRTAVNTQLGFTLTSCT